MHRLKESLAILDGAGAGAGDRTMVFSGSDKIEGGSKKYVKHNMLTLSDVNIRKIYVQ
jgi:hypothetical protein